MKNKIIYIFTLVALVCTMIFCLSSCACQHENVNENCTQGSCTKCGEIVSSGTGHNFGEWVETKTATLSVDGEKERECTKCGEIEKITVSLKDELKESAKEKLDSFHSRLKSNLLNINSYTVNSESADIFYDEETESIYLMLAVDFSAQNKAGGYTRYSNNRDYFVWTTYGWETISDVQLMLRIMEREFDFLTGF